MKQKPQGFRRVYPGSSSADLAAEKRMLTSGYETFHRHRRRAKILKVSVISLGVLGALVWLWMSVIPNLELF